MINIIKVDKLGHHKPAYALGLHASADLIMQGVFLWAPDWELPTLVAMDNDVCAGFASYTIDPDTKFLDVAFAVTNPAYRGGAQTFILLLAEIRQLAKETQKTSIRFTYHEANTSMKDAARILRARVRYTSAEIMVEDL